MEAMTQGAFILTLQLQQGLGGIGKQVGGTFHISFPNGGERVNGTNRYSGWIIGARENIPATYFLEHKGNEDLQYWYDFALGNKGPYILKVFGKCDYDVDGNRNEREILFTEVVEDTLRRDILSGIIHFHLKLKPPHGEICSDNIYIIDEKAKIAHIVDHSRYQWKSFEDDINQFCAMVQDLLNTNGLTTPLKLAQLFKSMKLYKHDNRYLCNSMNHPILLTPKERGELRHLAHSLIWESANLGVEKSLIEELKNATINFCGAIQGHYWIGNVGEQEFLKTLYLQTPPYGVIPLDLDFMRYNKNVGEHVRDTMSVEMNCLHHFCRDSYSSYTMFLLLKAYLSELCQLLHEGMLRCEVV